MNLNLGCHGSADTHDGITFLSRTFVQVQEILEGAKVLEWLREHAEIEYTTQ